MDEIRSEEVTEVTSLPVANEAAPEKENKSKIVSAILNLFSPQNRKKTIIAIAVILVIGIVAGCLISRGSPENVAVRFVEAWILDDLEKTHKVMAYDYYAYHLEEMSEEEFFEAYSDEFKEDIQIWKDLSDYCRTSMEENLEDEYGNYKLSFDVSRVKDMSIRRLEDEYEYTLDWLEEDLAFDRDDISDAKEVTVKCKIEGEDETERMTYTVCMVKMGGAWKVLDYDID